MIVVLFVIPLIALLSSRTLRRLAVRNALRRPRESALVIVGSLLATALMVAALVVGDSFGSSIRQFAYTQLGPIDEIATVTGPDEAEALRARLGDFQHPDTDGVFAMTVLQGTAATLDGEAARRAAPRAQLLEVDFEEVGAAFDVEQSGISGDGPTGTKSVVGEDLARKLEISVGDAFTVFAGGQQLDLTVERVVDQRGVAGFWMGMGSSSYNAFVEPGTIERLIADANVEAAPPTFMVAVSNTGGIEDSAGPSDVVAEAMRAELDGLDAEVVTAKQELLESADENGDSLAQLYSGISVFAVVAGILLMINIFRMLAEERRSEMGMMRAMGLRRSRLVVGFAIEGWLYATVATALGVLVGVGLGRLVVSAAAEIFAGTNEDMSLDIIFSWKAGSLVSGATIGYFIAMATVVGTAIATANFNVIAAIRDIDQTKVRKRTWPRVVSGTICVALGAALFAVGLGAKAATPLIVSVALVALGLHVLYRASRPANRLLLTLAAGSSLVWSVLAVTIAALIDADLEIDAFIVQGLVGVAAAVALTTEYQSEIGRGIARFSRDSLTVRLGLAYPLARRSRTAFTMGQFAVVVWILVYISVLSHMFAGQVDGLTRDVSGGFNTLVRSNPGNPIRVDELESLPGVTRVAPLAQVRVEITPPDTDEGTFWNMSSFDERFVEGGAPKLEARGEYATDDDAYRALLTDPNTVMVDAFFLSGGGGPPAAVVRVGDTITVKNTQNGRTKDLTVIAESADDWLFNGALMSPLATKELFGDAAVPNRAYVMADDPTSLSRTLEADFFRQGAESDPIRDLVDENLAQQNQFFGLMRSFLAIGLVIGIAGIGVIMVRAVRERRRQIGVLRALGFESRSVSNAFATESTFLALEGVLIGVGLAFVATWSITKSDDFGDGLTWRVPWAIVAILVVGTVLGSLLATLLPARTASKIKPSVALRITD